MPSSNKYRELCSLMLFMRERRRLELGSEHLSVEVGVPGPGQGEAGRDPPDLVTALGGVATASSGHTETLLQQVDIRRLLVLSFSVLDLHHHII